MPRLIVLLIAMSPFVPPVRLLVCRLPMLAAFAFVFALAAGCGETPGIRQYTIAGKLPDALRTQDRMLAAIIPQEDKAWFVKVVGPTAAVKSAEGQVRDFVTKLTFEGDTPVLTPLPPQWNRGSEKAMRFATLLIDTPDAQLDVSIRQLPLSGDWGEQVSMNVNRWRGQMKLTDSSDKWAGASPIEVAAKSDKTPVWVDLEGEMGAGPSLASMGGSAPFGNDSFANASPPAAPPTASPATTPVANGSAESEADSPLKYKKPESWSAGKMSMMRLAAFNIGPQDAPAELTIIQAGGDLRGNVARWLGQVRGDSPPDDVVDQALAGADKLKVSGRDAQRFYLRAAISGDDAQAIDATIVPTENGMSLFIKVTGKQKILEEEKERIGDFIASLQLP